MSDIRRLVTLCALITCNAYAARPALVTPKNAPHGVYVRNATHRIIGAITPNTRIMLTTPCHLEAKHGWCAVQLRDGVRGYASAEFLRAVRTDEITFTVRFLDVGRGNAAVIDSGESEVVIDGGADPNLLLHYLRARHLLKPVGLLVITSPEHDHWRGLQALLQATPVYEIWDSGYVPPCGAISGLREFRDACKRRCRRVYMPARQYRQEYRLGRAIYLPAIPEIGITLLSDGQALPYEPCSFKIGSASLVLKVDIGGAKFLFTSDINGKRADDDASFTDFDEASLISRWGRAAQLHADVLQVPHHGGGTASTSSFIQAVDAKYAVISADSRIRVPSQAVAQRYEDAGATVLRTDARSGAGNDHILCTLDEDREVVCGYEDAMDK